MFGQPVISVIIPAYNVEKYLEEALLSVRNQTLKNFEVVIVDDGSTDNTYEIAAQFCQQDSRFRVVHKVNGGLSSARNWGIQHSKAQYIALLDADDIYLPYKLATHVAILDSKPAVGVVYSASRAIRDDGALTPMILSGKPIHQNTVLALLCKNFVGHGSNAILRRCIFDEIGGFDETLRSSEDVDFWLRVATTQKWSFERITKVMCYYRVRPSGLSFNVAQMEKSRQQVLKSVLSHSPTLVQPMIPTAEAYLYRYLARLALSGGDMSKARDFIDRAMQRDASIFYRDFRSFITWLTVYLTPITRPIIKKLLGTTKPKPASQ